MESLDFEKRPTKNTYQKCYKGIQEEAAAMQRILMINAGTRHYFCRCLFNLFLRFYSHCNTTIKRPGTQLAQILIWHLPQGDWIEMVIIYNSSEPAKYNCAGSEKGEPSPSQAALRFMFNIRLKSMFPCWCSRLIDLPRGDQSIQNYHSLSLRFRRFISSNPNINRSNQNNASKEGRREETD
jgi:hypothetical protein